MASSQKHGRKRRPDRPLGLAHPTAQRSSQGHRGRYSQASNSLVENVPRRFQIVDGVSMLCEVALTADNAMRTLHERG